MHPRAVVLACLSGLALARGATALERPHSHSAEQNYALFCMGCHRPDGAGAPGKIPAFTDSLGPFMQLEDGRRYLLRVPGASNSALTDAELAAVMNLLVSRFAAISPPVDVRPFTADEVARVRRPALKAVRQVRLELIRRLEERGPAPREDY